MVEAFAQTLEDAQAAGELVAEIAVAMADGQIIKTKIIEDEDEGRLVVITVEPESTGAAVQQPENAVPAKKTAGKGRGKKSATSTEDVGE